jgi:hypothetical protein
VLGGKGPYGKIPIESPSTAKQSEYTEGNDDIDDDDRDDDNDDDDDDDFVYTSSIKLHIFIYICRYLHIFQV